MRAGVTLPEGHEAQIAYALTRAGQNPDECAVISKPVQTPSGGCVVRVELPDGRTMRVEY